MALSFSGSGQYLTLPSPVVTGYPFSFSCWFNAASFTSVPSLMSVYNVGAADRFAVFVNANGTVCAQSIHAGASTVATSTLAAIVGNWYHVCGVFTSPTSRTIYLNGANSATDTTNSTPVGLASTQLAAINAGHIYNGSEALPAFWNVALTPTDVAGLYNNGSVVDPRTIQSGSVVSMLPLSVASQFRDAVLGVNWTPTGSPTFVADPAGGSPVGGDPRFGFATHFAQGWPTSLMPLISATGVGYIRDDLSSSEWEPNQGVFQISPSNRTWCQAAHANGLLVVGIISGNGTYTTGDFWDPTLMANRAAFIAQSGLVDVIEVANEPNNAYRAYKVSIGRNWLTDLPILTTAITNAVNAVSSTVQVIGLGAQGSEIWGMYPGTVLDGVVYHPYDTGISTNPSTFVPDTCFEQPSGTNSTSSLVYVPWINICRFQTALPLWETEWGAGTFTGFSQDNQSCYLVRRLLTAAGLGVEHTLIYEFKDNNSTDLFGVYLINNTTPKSSYSAVTNLISALSGVTGAPASKPTFVSVANGNTIDAMGYSYLGTNTMVVSSWFGNHSPSAPPAASTCVIRFTVAFPFSVPLSTVTDPIAGTSVPLSTYSTSLSGSLLTVTGLPISDHPLLITLTQSTAIIIPTVVQHLATGLERNPLGTFNFTYPNPVKAGNCLIAAFQYNGSNLTSVTSITSVPSGTWVLGKAVPNTTFSNVAIYYLLNATAGITSVTITMAGLSSQEAAMQGAFSEFNNIVTSGALDVAVGNGTPGSLSPGTLTTTAADLIYHFAINGSATSPNGGNYNSTTPIVAGAGFTLLSADLQTGAVVQISTPSSPGSFTPTFTASGTATDTWESVAIALKTSSSTQGSPASGFYIGKITHTLIYSIAQGHTPTTCKLQYPYSGNLLVSSFDSANETIGSITDSAGNTWLTAASTTGPGAFNCSDIHYAQNTNQSSLPSNLITVNLVINASLGLSDIMFTVYDIHGAETAAFDKAITKQGTQNTPNLVGGFNQLTELSIADNFFPSTASGIIIAGDSHQFTSTVGIVGAGYIFDSVWNNLNHNIGGGTQTSTLDEDNARGHIFNTNTSPVNFIFNGNLATDQYGSWSICVAAFKAALIGPTLVNATIHLK